MTTLLKTIANLNNAEMINTRNSRHNYSLNINGMYGLTSEYIWASTSLFIDMDFVCAAPKHVVVEQKLQSLGGS
jgi:hypothetical protein